MRWIVTWILSFFVVTHEFTLLFGWFFTRYRSSLVRNGNPPLILHVMQNGIHQDLISFLSLFLIDRLSIPLLSYQMGQFLLGRQNGYMGFHSKVISKLHNASILDNSISMEILVVLRVQHLHCLGTSIIHNWYKVSIFVFRFGGQFNFLLINWKISKDVCESEICRMPVVNDESGTKFNWTIC